MISPFYLTVLGGASLVLWIVVVTIKGILFDRNCGGHLLRATAANSIALAKQELEIVVGYFRRRGWTSGYTSVVYRTPEEDVGFFYRNLKESLQQLQAYRGGVASMEKNTLLMRLRTSITDLGLPEGISVFPHNKAYALWALLSLAALVIGGFEQLMSAH